MKAATSAMLGTAALMMLAGCGSSTALKPLPDMTAIPKAKNAQTAETAEQMMTPSTQAQPERTVDLLTRSQERGDDPFDKPPGNGTTPN